MVRAVRRIVTGNDEHRLSHVPIDATAAYMQRTLTELWHTDSMQASNAGTSDTPQTGRVWNRRAGPLHLHNASETSIKSRFQKGLREAVCCVGVWALATASPLNHTRAAAKSRVALAPISGPVPSFNTTVHVIPALTRTSGGTFVMRMRTGIRCANLTQVKVGFTAARSSGPLRLS